MISPQILCFKLKHRATIACFDFEAIFLRQVMLVTMLGIRNRYDGAMTDPGTGTGDVPALDAAQLDAYFALMEAVSLLQHNVEQQLRAEGDLSYVQFQLLARLAAARGQLTMTELADGVVYSRSGLTYQAGLLEKAGPITRAGLALLGQVMPGHIHVGRRLLFQPLSDGDVGHLGDIMTRVRDHMRAQPPRSAAPRKRRPAPARPAPAA